MTLDEVRLAELSVLAGIRPTLALALASLACLFGVVEPVGPLEVLGHPVVAALALTLAGVELAAEREGFAAAVGGFDLRRALFVVRGIAALIAALAASGTLAEALDHDFSDGDRLLHGGLALASTTIKGAARARVTELLAGTGQRFMARLEEGGLLVALILAWAFPLLLLVAMVMLSMLTSLMFGMSWLVDRARRRGCPHCGHRARVEAVRCPRCQERLDPARWLEPPARLLPEDPA